MIVLILVLGALCVMVAVAFEYNVFVGILFSVFAIAPFVIVGVGALLDRVGEEEDSSEE